MKMVKRKICFAIFCVSVIILSGPVYAQGRQQVDITIIHTNDLHSHFDGNGPDGLYTAMVGDGDPVLGQYARLGALIQRERHAATSPVLLIDAGDFFGGTLYHLIGPRVDTELNPEFEFFQLLSYDFTTFGNHEFDARNEGLNTMLSKAYRSKTNFKILASNLIPDPKVPWFSFFGVSQSGLILPRAVRTFSIKGREIKVGVLGIIGPDALLVSRDNRAPVHFVGFDDEKNRAQIGDLYDLLETEVKNMREKEKVDLVILIAHAGPPEDEKIAKHVDGIDLIIGGHTHDLYPTPKHIGRTWLAQTGEYGKNLGVLKFALAPHGPELLNQGQTFIPVDDKVEADKQVSEAMAHYQSYLKNVLAEKIGHPPDMKVVSVQKDFPHKHRTNKELGELVTGGIKEELERKFGRPIDLYFSSMSLIRDGLALYGKETPYLFSDIFRILSIGFDQNWLPGTPIVHFYLSKHEVELLINFMEIYSKISKNFRPAFSPNLKYEVRWWGIPMLNRLKDLTLNGHPYSEWPELLHVATSNYVASYVDRVGPMTYGLVNFVPKDENGHPLKEVVITPYKEYLLFTDFLLSKQVLR